MKPTGKRRALGQHFLIDENVQSLIANAALNDAKRIGAKAVLEIGPGRGAITQHLLRHADSLPIMLIERDFELAAYWKAKTSQDSPLQEVICNDFLEVEKSQWLRNAPLVVVSNLPYSAGTAIFTRLAQHRVEIAKMVLMFQKEVADRIIARESTADRGSLSLFAQNLWEIELLLQVSPRAFRPPPRVDSSVLLFRPRKSPLVPGTDKDLDHSLWQQLLKVAFTHRRKMLRSGLPKTGPWLDCLTQAGIDPCLRPEALDWSQWIAYFQAIRSNSLDGLTR